MIIVVELDNFELRPSAFTIVASIASDITAGLSGR